MPANKSIKPFENETESIAIDDLTIENRMDRISIYGSLQITRDKAGLKLAQELKELLDATVTVLQSEKLPNHLAVAPAENVKNPFDE